MSILKKVRKIFEDRNLNEINSKDFPMPYSMLGVQQASKIIANGIKNNKKLAIVGDYDVDGVSSTCIFDLFLKKIGFQNYTLKIPNRFSDGYGINKNIIDLLNADIYITLDNGISAFEAATYCKEKNKILIITDHHKPIIKDEQEILPNADVIINPNQKECEFLQKEVCGAVVTWILCGGIKKEMGLDLDMREFSPFITLAIISDVMPLVSLNRSIYKMGIIRINNSKSTPFDTLKEQFGKIDSQKIGFYITPILNSAGRLKDAKLALDFLKETNKKKSKELFLNLININNERKTIQNDVFLSAKNSFIKCKNIVVSYGEGWNEGVLGIVAAKLTDEFNISSFCFSLKDGILKGSGRQKGGINLIASVQKCSNLLLNFGGHSGAVGLSLELKNLYSFIKILDENIILDSNTSKDSELEIDIDDISMELLELLESYEPYGNGNEMLKFKSNNLKVIDSMIVGNNHQVLKFKNKACVINSIIFNNKKNFLNKNINIEYFIQRDKFKNLQLLITDIKSST
ncbi:single-stranded-DNA-specific exonuclease RecJ [Helicobacter sp. MIT 14-3879]|uniref:single-stranded-DNA-specific exonuclease RecJ n=1 Tax=Helicobacter sp. MIT 14-3879 TaxID=2040649 RepID=UPI000E1E4D57|nr:single-stranded-DNA-specific exonuclease RecJ [Helicobacter sp. MIT 14-3879]RDU65047.1 single-stranded-DNA-specific exonuclease RecJ [Helicobacter sp. MIT 14-3879]